MKNILKKNLNFTDSNLIKSALNIGEDSMPQDFNIKIIRLLNIFTNIAVLIISSYIRAISKLLVFSEGDPGFLQKWCFEEWLFTLNVHPWYTLEPHNFHRFCKSFLCTFKVYNGHKQTIWQVLLMQYEQWTVNSEHELKLSAQPTTTFVFIDTRHVIHQL